MMIGENNRQNKALERMSNKDSEETLDINPKSGITKEQIRKAQNVRKHL